ncbi:MAG: hypothetical protein EZS28_015490, partial [Streblomastix strix]
YDLSLNCFNFSSFSFTSSSYYSLFFLFFSQNDAGSSSKCGGSALLTFHVNMITPPAPAPVLGLEQRLSQIPDIIVFGLEEVALNVWGILLENTGKAEQWGNALLNGVNKTVGEYLLEGANADEQEGLRQFAALALIVIAKNSLKENITDVMIEKVGVGLRDKMGNKGAVALRMALCWKDQEKQQQQLNQNQNQGLDQVAHMTAKQKNVQERVYEEMKIRRRLLFNLPSPDKLTLPYKKSRHSLFFLRHKDFDVAPGFLKEQSQLFMPKNSYNNQEENEEDEEEDYDDESSDISDIDEEAAHSGEDERVRGSGKANFQNWKVEEINEQIKNSEIEAKFKNKSKNQEKLMYNQFKNQFLNQIAGTEKNELPPSFPTNFLQPQYNTTNMPVPNSISIQKQHQSANMDENQKQQNSNQQNNQQSQSTMSTTTSASSVVNETVESIFSQGTYNAHASVPVKFVSRLNPIEKNSLKTPFFSQNQPFPTSPYITAPSSSSHFNSSLSISQVHKPSSSTVPLKNALSKSYTNQSANVIQQATLSIFDHDNIFFFGDLNYRIKLESKNKLDGKKDKKSKQSNLKQNNNKQENDKKKIDKESSQDMDKSEELKITDTIKKEKDNQDNKNSENKSKDEDQKTQTQILSDADKIFYAARQLKKVVFSYSAKTHDQINLHKEGSSNDFEISGLGDEKKAQQLWLQQQRGRIQKGKKMNVDESNIQQLGQYQQQIHQLSLSPTHRPSLSPQPQSQPRNQINQSSQPNSNQQSQTPSRSHHQHSPSSPQIQQHLSPSKNIIKNFNVSNITYATFPIIITKSKAIVNESAQEIQRQSILPFAPLPEFDYKDYPLQFLLMNDELRRQMKNKTTFNGFREGTIKFRPTYKFKKNTLDYSNNKNKVRPPAYCDRILWFAGDDDDETIERTKEEEDELRTAPKLVQVEYDSIEYSRISDHIPVFAHFHLFLPEKQQEEVKYLENDQQNKDLNQMVHKENNSQMVLSGTLLDENEWNVSPNDQK